jgi:hypothetical protein
VIIMAEAIQSPSRPNLIPNVVPLSALRHRRAVQYCFTPNYNTDGPVPRCKRVEVEADSLPAGRIAESLMPTMDVRFQRYPAENYCDEVTAEELSFLRSAYSEKLFKSKKKHVGGEPISKPKTGLAPAPPKPSRGRNGVQQSAELQQERLQLAMAEYLCVGTSEPVVELPRLEAPDEVGDASTDSDEDGNSFLVSAVSGKAMVSSAVDAAPTAGEYQLPVSVAKTVTPRIPAQSYRLQRTKSQLQRPKLSLEERDSQRMVPDPQSGQPRALRRLVYIPPPHENIPTWLPLVRAVDIAATPGSPSSPKVRQPTSPLRRMASTVKSQASLGGPVTGISAKSGRFSPNGGFYVPATMDDEYFSSSNVRVVKRHADDATTAAQRALEAQRATFDRLSRPNVVSEASTTFDEGRVLRYLASRRESSVTTGVLPSAPSPIVASSGVRSPAAPALGIATPLGNASFGMRASPPILAIDGTMTPRAAARVKFADTPSLSPLSQAKVDAEKDERTNEEALLTYREQLPNSSRSSGCVGAAEAHYWLELGHQGRPQQYKRDQDACVAQVWMRRSLTEECHSARTVLRNYATRIPKDAVLAVTLRGVSFGQRDADITITFSYGECCQDEALSGVASTIRTIVKESNNSDTAKFRGPFLMCSATKQLCDYLRSYCLGMSSAEHPELAVLGFPGAHVTMHE